MWLQGEGEFGEMNNLEGVQGSTILNLCYSCFKFHCNQKNMKQLLKAWKKVRKHKNGASFSSPDML